MKKLLSFILLFYSVSLTAQKIFLDEYKASVVDSSQAKYFETIAYGSDSKTFKKRTFAITGEKFYEFDFVSSPNNEGIPYLWFLGFPDKKFVQNGVSMTWYKNGQLQSQGNFINGKQAGKMQTWHENGNLKSEMSYKDGKNEGKSLSWYENGQLESESNYVNGKNEGESHSWYKNGKLKSEFSYTNGCYNGDVITYWPNGQVRREDHYLENKFQNGACYDSLGNEVKHTMLESMPEYLGGEKQLMKDISKRVQYPELSKNLGIQGKVLVRFAVDEKGEITDEDILMGVNSELNLEAIRVISTLRFKPGSYDGEAVKVYYMVPLNFFLR
jgi:TonB family protein